MIPEYYGCIEDDGISGYDKIITDFGVADDNNISEITESDMACIVVSAAPWKMAESADKVRFVKEACDGTKAGLTVLVAPCSYACFKRFTQEYGIINPVRIPYRP